MKGHWLVTGLCHVDRMPSIGFHCGHGSGLAGHVKSRARADGIGRGSPGIPSSVSQKFVDLTTHADWASYAANFEASRNPEDSKPQGEGPAAG